jgi:hypothetical protein
MNGWICLGLWGGWIVIAILWSVHTERADRKNIQDWERSARLRRISSSSGGDVEGGADVDDSGCGSGCGGCGE